jgi:hypothetical protein
MFFLLDEYSLFLRKINCEILTENSLENTEMKKLTKNKTTTISLVLYLNFKTVFFCFYNFFSLLNIENNVTILSFF